MEFNLLSINTGAPDTMPASGLQGSLKKTHNLPREQEMQTRS
jgi:hypothetical protein